MSHNRWQVPLAYPRGHRIGALWVAVVALSLFPGCSEDISSEDISSEDISSGGDGVDATVTDSAGVQIVRVGGEVLDSLPEWSLSQEPLLTIGEPYVIGKIEDALRLRSGAIVIAEGIGLHLRVFGPDGVLRRSFGREGEGPGEFKAISLWTLQDGGFAVGDNWLNRITLFDESGTVNAVRTGACRMRGGPSLSALGIPRCHFEGLTGDGTAFWSGTRESESMPILEPDVVLRYPGEVGFLARDAEDSATMVDSVRRGTKVRIAESFPGRGLLHWIFQELFSSEGHWAFGPHSIAVGESSRFEVRLRDTTGQLQRILRVVRAPDVVTEAHIDEIRDVVGTSASVMTEEIGLKYLDEVDARGVIPFFSELRFDLRGNLWIAEYVPDEMLVIADERRWIIFDDTAMPLARMTTGPLDDILEFGDDYLLVRERNELDIERVALFRIERE